MRTRKVMLVWIVSDGMLVVSHVACGKTGDHEI